MAPPRTKTKRGTMLKPSTPDQARPGSRLRLKDGARATISLGVQQTRILMGEEDLSEWDMEELRHGQRRASNGSFTGRPPKVVPRAVYLELVERLLAEGHQAMLDQLMPAIRKLAEMVDGYKHNDEGERITRTLDDGSEVYIPITVDPAQLKAVQEVLVRIMGKPETKVTVRADKKPYERVERVVIDRDLGDYDDEIIDTTAVEE